ncbi:MAG: TRAP transporter permease [Pseudomonadota bacterium]
MRDDPGATSAGPAFWRDRLGVWLVTGLALAFAVFHIRTGYTGVLPDLQQRGIHLALVLGLAFLVTPAWAGARRDSRIPLYDLALAVLAVAVCLYPAVNYMEISQRMGFPTFAEQMLGVVTILLVLEAARRLLGWVMVAIVAVFVGYLWFGLYLPIDWGGHAGFSFRRAVSTLYLSQEGILGPTLGASASFIALFILFGAVVKATGTGQLIIDLAQAALGTVRGGPAKIAMVASAAMGTISGSATANAASTGMFTIPLMRRLGYGNRFAGAVEAVSSTGGQLMPPVMGSAAFIMAEYLQMPYREIAAAALIPAILFYLMLFVTLDLEAARLGLRGVPREELPRVRAVLVRGGHLLIGPTVLVVYLAIFKTTALQAAFAGLVAAALAGLLRRHTRLGLGGWVEALRDGALMSLQVAVACAAAGLIIGPVFLTGLGPRLADILVTLAGQQLAILLVLAMVASLIMSMGLPSTAVYILTAVLIAPSIIALGVEPLAAHMFAYWFGTMANITPPVATAAYAAAGIAGSNPIATGVSAVRLGLAGFLLPFMFVYGPALLLIGSPGDTLLLMGTAGLGVVALAAGLQGFVLQPMTALERALAVAGALSLVHGGTITDLAGISAVLVAAALHILRARRS